MSQNCTFHRLNVLDFYKNNEKQRRLEKVESITFKKSSCLHSWQPDVIQKPMNASGFTNHHLRSNLTCAHESIIIGRRRQYVSIQRSISYTEPVIKMCHHLIILVNSEVRSNGPDICESETELNKMKKKKKSLIVWRLGNPKPAPFSFLQPFN